MDLIWIWYNTYLLFSYLLSLPNWNTVQEQKGRTFIIGWDCHSSWICGIEHFSDQDQTLEDFKVCKTVPKWLSLLDHTKKQYTHTHTHTHTPSPQPRPQCRNPVSFREFPTRMIYLDYISRVSDQNGVSVLYIMLDIHHSGWEPWIYRHRDIPFWSETLELFCVYPEYILFSSAAGCTTWQTRSMLLFGRWRQRKGAASPSRWPTWWSSACPRASSRTRSTPA